MGYVNSPQEALGVRPGVEPQPGTRAPQDDTPSPRRSRAEGWVGQLRFPLAVYAGSRLLYLIVGVFDTWITHGWPLPKELANWDGVWYLYLAGNGYPTHVSHIQTTLGFFPLYPILMTAVSHALFITQEGAGLIVAGIGGFVATVLVQRLATGWWDARAGRRAVVFFCLFPGSIVFSMIYSEGLMLPLAAGAILALERRRWMLAGLLAGLATAAGPTAVAIIPACAVAAFLELRRRGWTDPQALRSLAAPVLAPLGIVAFGIFLWAWTGSPFASYTAQRYGWDERTNLLALGHTTSKMVGQVLAFHSLHHPGINLNYVSGVVGAVFLIVALVLIARTRPTVSAPAIAWTLGIAFLTLTSSNVPPNPRMLLMAFPALAIIAYKCTGKAYRRLIVTSTVLLVAMSIVSFVGTGLRP
jgi:hypothetical protein